MRKILLTLTLIFIAGAGFNVAAQNKNALIGNWEYQVPQAPYGYESGAITFSAEKETLAGVINFKSGYRVRLQQVAMSNDTLRANAYVEGELINLEAKVTKNNMTGVVDTSMGKMNLKAEKIAAAKKK